MRYILDTNICIYAIKHKPPEVFLKLQTMEPKDVCISSITYAELMHGVEKSAAVEKNRLALTLLLSTIEIIDFDLNAAEHYGGIRAELEKKGMPIGTLDMMIASHARSLGYTIVTNISGGFSRVSGLCVENWVKRES